MRRVAYVLRSAVSRPAHFKASSLVSVSGGLMKSMLMLD
jgi:hypothetical protein